MKCLMLLLASVLTDHVQPSSELRLQVLQVGVAWDFVSQSPPPGQTLSLQQGIVGVSGPSGDGSRGAEEGVCVGFRHN